MTTMTDVPAVLTVPEVADRLRVSTRQVWRLIRDDELETVRIGARGVRVTVDQLSAYLARQAERERDLRG